MRIAGPIVFLALILLVALTLLPSCAAKPVKEEKKEPKFVETRTLIA
jgi:Na+-transporting methylmalonyl-CoA/oxaloacetate decarboxylase gamma subunit